MAYVVGTVVITDGVTEVTLPKIKKINVGGEIVKKTVTMASGKEVEEIIGFRPAFTGEWDYVAESTLQSLLTLLKTKSLLTVTYPDPVDTYVTGVYRVSYPQVGIFKYVLGSPMWHGVSIEFSAQEVV